MHQGPSTTNAAPARAVIYARFSSDLQDNRSIADQVAICREYAARNGWSVVSTYADHAISGASMHGRAEFLRLIADAEAGRFNIVIAEDVDRYGRNAADVMRFQQIAEFAGVRIFTVADGEASELLFGFKGLMSAMWLKTHALKTRRGQEGRVRAGLAPGGRCYGYASVPGKPGERTIIDAEAEIVRRIFREYVDGRTPRAIAHDLNRDRIQAPRGPRWNASTINGNNVRGCGIITNPLYRGVIRFNRVRMVKDPSTGKRISRANTADDFREAPAPALAIVPADLAQAALDRKTERGKTHMSQQRAPRHIFSGLLRCASCGGGLATSGVDKSGRKRLRCTTDRESGTCPAPATFYLDTVERLILARLRDEFRDPQVAAEYVREYHAERQRLAGRNDARRAAITKRQAQVEREITRAVDAIVQGAANAALMGEKTHELAAERDALAAELATLAPPQVVTLHPTTLARYERQVGALQDCLGRPLAGGDDVKAAAAIRALVQSVTVKRDPARPEGLSLVIATHVEALLGATDSAVCGKAVAGAGYRLSAHPPLLLAG